MFSVAEARQRLLEKVTPLSDVETRSISDCLGRILAADLKASMSLPPFQNSAMDGYAVRRSDPALQGPPPYRLRVLGTSAAGHPWPGRLERGAIRIFTGAALPRGADTVVLQEDARREGKWVEFTETPETNRHVRAVGTDVHKGDQLAARGTRLRAFELSWCAACGIERLPVFAQPRIGIFATGDELREPGVRLAYGQIYESNRLMLNCLASELPAEVNNLGILSDDRRKLLDALARAAEDNDMLITSGGVSVGESDHVRDVVQELGDIDFWKVAIKPGKPFASGRIGDCMFMGLPGNPASAAVTFLLFVAPAILQLAGGKPQAPLEIQAKLAASVKPPRGRMEYQRGHYRPAGEHLWVEQTGSQDSNRIGSFRDANCLIRLVPGTRRLRFGTRVAILPFHGLLSGA